MGSDGLAVHAELKMPMGLPIDYNGTLYIADNLNARVQGIGLATGKIHDFAGLGWRLHMYSPGYSGDKGSALLARMASPRCIAIDANGYVTELLNHIVRVIRPDNNNNLEGIVTLGLMYLLFQTEDTVSPTSGSCRYCGGLGEATKPVFDIADGVSRDKVLECLCCRK